MLWRGEEMNTPAAQARTRMEAPDKEHPPSAAFFFLFIVSFQKQASSFAYSK